ncbi:hypothetical protein Pyn_06957 [Prunus yedoensis var. nudiflora]|uniref:Uncharacterized protein n=1 Tax=Prunus yedoensis var. nudiflora TaxID=2094558 RepID=A0A314ZNJ7_PRUYE|nr:hypothetical protein Pyn_06957 [Prunus yedoensis var. nudiflora]
MSWARTTTMLRNMCPNPHCRKRYSSLDALYLTSMEDDGSCFHRESCNGELVVASDSHARRPRGQELKDRLQRMEVQMKPITEQLDRVRLAFS